MGARPICSKPFLYAVAQIIEDEYQFTIFTWHRECLKNILEYNICKTYWNNKKVLACGRPHSARSVTPCPQMSAFDPTPLSLCRCPLWMSPSSTLTQLLFHLI